MRAMRWQAGLVAALLWCLSPEAWSCAVCVGNPNDPQTIGMSKAILGLLIVTGGVLAAFASFFVVLWRRARRPADTPAFAMTRLEQDVTRREEVAV